MLMFPITDDVAKLLGRNHEFREPVRRRKQAVRSECLNEGLQGESEEPQATEPPDDVEAHKDFWTFAR